MHRPIQPRSPVSKAAAEPSSEAHATEGAEAARPTRTGHVYFPRVSEDAGLFAAAFAISRVARQKTPYTAIVNTEADKAALQAAIEADRATGLSGKFVASYHRNRDEVDRGLLRESGSTREWALRRDAARRAAEKEIEIRSVEADHALARLDPESTKLYVFGHAFADPGGMAYRRPDRTVESLKFERLAQELGDRGLPLGYRDVRPIMCFATEVSDGPGQGTAPAGLRLADSMGRAGFRNVKISAYPGAFRFFPSMFEDGQLHRAVRLDSSGGPEFKRASTVRQEFSPADTPPQSSRQRRRGAGPT